MLLALLPGSLDACMPRAITPQERDSLPALIPRGLLFANPERAWPQLSPDGKRIAFLSNDEGVQNIFVASVVAIDDAHAITHVRSRNLRRFDWSGDGTYVLYSLDVGGDENWRVHAVDVQSGVDRELVGARGAQALVERISAAVPDRIVVSLNERNPGWPDLYTIDLSSGNRVLLLKNQRPDSV